jgi:hypothetical protein
MNKLPINDDELVELAHLEDIEVITLHSIEQTQEQKTDEKATGFIESYYKKLKDKCK